MHSGVKKKKQNRQDTIIPSRESVENAKITFLMVDLFIIKFHKKKFEKFYECIYLFIFSIYFHLN